MSVKKRFKIYDWHRTSGLGRCNALDRDGHWCRRSATHEGGYHGDSELVGYRDGDLVSWVLVRLCDLHVGETQAREASLTDGQGSR